MVGGEEKGTRKQDMDQRCARSREKMGKKGGTQVDCGLKTRRQRGRRRGKGKG